MLTKNESMESILPRRQEDRTTRSSSWKKGVGNVVIVILVLVTILLWVTFPPPPYPENNVGRNYPRQFAGEVIGSVVMVLMACSLFLAARPKWAEPFFGGLDRMYLTHRRCSESAFLLLFAHVLTVPISTHREFPLGGYIGLIAFPGIVTIVLMTIAPRITFLNKLTGGTYKGWKRLHRFIGIFFILGYLHSLTLGSLTLEVQRKWLDLFFFLGTGSYLYTELLGRFFKKFRLYTVAAVNHLNPSITEIVMHPQKKAIAPPRAGQFLFVRFKNKGLNESHPFTISSAPHEDAVRLTIKASGDFTRHLHANLKTGTEAILEGPYGMFDYKTGGSKQVWLAGGIGVTPFLSFVRDLDAGQLDKDIDFYYIASHREEAVFVEEIEAAAKRHPRLKAHIRYAATNGQFNFETILNNAGGDIARHDVYMCCPLSMKLAFEQKFRQAGVRTGNIHYEEFNFR
jgi:predicted ferric reductase